MSPRDSSIDPQAAAAHPHAPRPDAWDSAADANPVASGPLRWLLLGIGVVFVGLAVVGAVLPVIPTTPFLLVAAACFSRSSSRFYHWLLENRLFGPLIRSWRATRTIPLRAKVSAIALVGIVGGTSVVFYVVNPWAKLAVGAILLGLIGFFVWIPTSARSEA